MSIDSSSVDISLCVANYNGAQVLEACLASIFSQVTAASFEVIVHDDASNDGSFDKITAKYPRLKILRSESNVGYCCANHLMAEAASGQFLLLLNNDIELLPGAIDSLWQEAHASSEQILSLAEYDMQGQLSCLGMGLDIFFTPYACKGTGKSALYAMGACLLISKALWNDTGGYPESFVYSGEDLYLCLAARARGVPTKILTHSGYRHHISHSTNDGAPSPRRRAYSERNRAYILSNMLPPGEKLLLQPLFYLMFWLERVWLRLNQGPTALIEAPPLTPRVEPQVPLLKHLAIRASKVLHILGR